MLQLVRVDHRLIHGQVALSWVKAYASDAVLVANDQAATDDLQRSTLRMAKPADTKLAIKTIDDAITSIGSGATDALRMFVVVGSIHDAYRLATACDAVRGINLGGTRSGDGTRKLSKLVNVTEQDLTELDELSSAGLTIEIRAVAADCPIAYTEARKALLP